MELERSETAVTFLGKKIHRSPFPSLRKHAYLIEPHEDFTISDYSLCHIVKQLSGFMPKQQPIVKRIGYNILIFEFAKPQRLRLNYLERADCSIKRIKLIDIYQYLDQLDLN